MKMNKYKVEKYLVFIIRENPLTHRAKLCKKNNFVFYIYWIFQKGPYNIRGVVALIKTNNIYCGI